MHGGVVGEGHGAPLGNRNGVGHGPPTGNTNAKTHGLFSKSLGAHGLEVYGQAKGMSDEDAARDAAHFALAKIAEAFGQDREFKGATGLVAEFLDQCVAAERISESTAERVLMRMSEPDIVALGKALAPIKSLLDFKKVGEGDGDERDPLEALTTALKASLNS